MKKVTMLLSGAAAMAVCVVHPVSTNAAGPPSRPFLLDTNPPRSLDAAQRYQSTTLAITAKKIQWDKPVVTVAFRRGSGSPGLYKLIEDTVRKWTDLGPYFKFNFKNANDDYLTWSPEDSYDDRNNKAPDIRIGFEKDGYWSDIGVIARLEKTSDSTMNFEGFPTELAPYFAHADDAGWLKSYSHSVILHEFGHALGLAHEHYHPDCQKDLKFSTDPGYYPTIDANGRFIPDNQHRVSGVIFSLMGAPNNWSSHQAVFNMDAAYYFAAISKDAVAYDDYFHAGTAFDAVTNPHIDQASIMLYAFDPSYFKSGKGSPCVSTGDGTFDGVPDEHFATTLSKADIEFFKFYYGPNLGK